MTSRARLLGCFLILLGLAQAGLYLAWRLSPVYGDRLFYIDPRLSLGFFEDSMSLGATLGPGLPRWLSAVGLLAIAGALASGRGGLRAYILFETVFAASTLTFFVIVIRAGMSPAHGFSIDELFIPGVVFVLFSLAPLVTAFLIEAREKIRGDLTLSAAVARLREAA